MNRRTLRATGIVLTGMLLAGDPVSMIYAAPVAGVSVATTAEAVAVGTGSSSPSAGVSLAVADCLYDTADLSVYEKNANFNQMMTYHSDRYRRQTIPKDDFVEACIRHYGVDIINTP